MDDTYTALIFDGRQPDNCYEFATELTERSKLIVINCVSKMYAMTGFRIGWTIAQPGIGSRHGEHTSPSRPRDRRRRRNGPRWAR